MSQIIQDNSQPQLLISFMEVSNPSSDLYAPVGFSQVDPTSVMLPTRNTASLYVGDLNWKVSEQLLWDIFSPYGSLLSVKICRNEATHPSVCYAYVNFSSYHEAKNALDGVNLTPINGTPCRVMWKTREPTIRTQNEANIYIKNIHPELDAKSLLIAYSAFGAVLSCKIAYDEYGLSKCHAFIQFENETSAEMACNRTNGITFGNKRIVVNKFVSKAERIDAKPVDQNQFTNVYVKNFPSDWTEDHIKKLFEIFGEITSLVIQKDENGSSLCFGFVNFAKHEFAATAVDKLNNIKVENGNILTVCRAMKLRERKAFLNRQHNERKLESNQQWKNLTLYVKNFTETTNDTKLREMFQQFGEIKRAYVVKNDRNQSRCFGFVSFNKPEEATKAIKEMHGKLVDELLLYVSHAQNREERENTFKQQQYNSYFLGPSIATSGGVHFAYEARGIFPYTSSSLVPRYHNQPDPNRRQPKDFTYKQNFAYPFQGNYHNRNNDGGSLRSSNQESYKPKLHKSQNAQVKLSTNQVGSEHNVHVSRKDKPKIQMKQKSPLPDVREEFRDRIFKVCQECFKSNNYDNAYLNRVSGIVIDYFGNESDAHKNTKDIEIIEGAQNVYRSLVDDKP